jgi:hypothetical protein
MIVYVFDWLLCDMRNMWDVPAPHFAGTGAVHHYRTATVLCDQRPPDFWEDHGLVCEVTELTAKLKGHGIAPARPPQRSKHEAPEAGRYLASPQERTSKVC